MANEKIKIKTLKSDLLSYVEKIKKSNIHILLLQNKINFGHAQLPSSYKNIRKASQKIEAPIIPIN